MNEELKTKLYDKLPEFFKKILPIVVTLFIIYLAIVLTVYIFTGKPVKFLTFEINIEVKHDTVTKTIHEYIHDTIHITTKEGSVQFFTKNQEIYMGWIYNPKQNNIYKGLTLDTTENGDSIPINGKNCKHALGMFAEEHDKGYVIYKLENRCSEFKADILLVKSHKGHEKEPTTDSYYSKGKGVRFKIYGDGKILYKDSIIYYNKPKPVSIRVDSVRFLRLEVETMQDGDNWGANSCWANARVIIR